MTFVPNTFFTKVLKSNHSEQPAVAFIQLSRPIPSYIAELRALPKNLYFCCCCTSTRISSDLISIWSPPLVLATVAQWHTLDNFKDQNLRCVVHTCTANASTVKFTFFSNVLQLNSGKITHTYVIFSKKWQWYCRFIVHLIWNISYNPYFEKVTYFWHGIHLILAGPTFWRISHGHLS